MKKSFLLLYVFSSLVGLLSAQSFQITGRITDQNTGEPLGGAYILLAPTLRTTASDYDGSYTLSKLPAGKYTLRVLHLGYATASRELELSNNLVVEIALEPYITLADEVVVRATRTTDNSGVAYTNVSREELSKQNLGQDLPILLNFTPSIVTTSDAGAGVGYTGLRIRGSDATRINVTINGIPVNDAESQGVFWVNMPDFASSVQSIQIQRGVGSSTNGAGAFGATVSMQTHSRQDTAHASFANTYGSFNTWKHTAQFGSGLINGKFAVDGRLSRISSDGFVDRAKSLLKSFFLAGAYYGKKSSLRLNIFSGNERTYQAWNGVPEARLRGDVAGMQAFIARNGLDGADAQNLLQSNNRTYNFYTYPNQNDNYQQDHYQLHYALTLGTRWQANAALHYTYGRGYFEEYRKQDALSNYGLSPVVIGGQSVEASDLVRRRWLDNDFYGIVYSLHYTAPRFQATLGGGYSRYLGRHFGELIWAQISNATPQQRYYENTAEKRDANVYLKAEYALSRRLNVYADLQVRHVDYAFLGKINDFLGIRNAPQNATLTFFNPKAGFNYEISPRTNFYGFVGVAQREPNRDDYTQSTTASRPQAERLMNAEAGYRLNTTRLVLQINGYGMWYRNQLALTGKVNDVGAYIRQNIARSYRLGLEVEMKYRLTNSLTWQANFTLSRNKIQNFTEFVDTFDENFVAQAQTQNRYAMPDIAFSPNMIGGSSLLWQPSPRLELALLSKYVGKQYLDNTQSEQSRLDAYFTNDIRVGYTLLPRFAKTVVLSLLVNNVFNTLYESNGYTFGYLVGQTRIRENFYYPQAGTNFLLGVEVKF